MRKLLILRASLFGLALSVGPFASLALAQSSATVTADRERYYNGESATVTLTGLADCAGQQVELGFTQTTGSEEIPAPVGDASPVVTVGADGSSTVTMVMTPPLIPFGHATPVVRGNCVPDGEILGTPRSITVLSATGPGIPPEPPNTGSGATIADDGPRFGPIAAMSGLVAVMAAGVLAVGARLASRRR